MDLDADCGSAAGIARLRAGDDRACALPARLLDRRPELVAQARARHGEQIAAGVKRCTAGRQGDQGRGWQEAYVPATS